jgi:tRNA nucleotidyltransferase (CCA-adding enzyme)
MSRDVVTAAPEMPVSEMERLMIDHDVGRLPVVESDRVIGVVTRSDLLRALHGARYAEGFRPWGTDDVRDRMESRLPDTVLHLLRTIGELATAQGVTAFVVGGFVRDLLLDVPSLDLDVLTDRDAIRVAAEFARVTGGKLKGHHQFATAEVRLPEDQAVGSLKIDFATARAESYGRPGALPEVEISSIQQDLRRRDFTINAMAVQINTERFGRLLDPYGGRRDLERRIVRVLHNLSFVEDPTRIFRAVRFEARFEYRMDNQSEQLARHALSEGALDTVAPERLRREFYRLFGERSPARALGRLVDLGVLAALYPGLDVDLAFVNRTEASIDWLQERVAERLDRHAIYLAALLDGLEPGEAARVCRERLRIPPQKAAIVEASLAAKPGVLPVVTSADARPSAIYRALRDLPLEALAILHASADNSLVGDHLQRYLTRLRGTGLTLSGSDLIAAGYRPSPRFGVVLRQVLDARLDGDVAGRDEEMALALSLLGSPKAESVCETPGTEPRL